MASKTSGIIIGLAAFSFVAFSSCGGMFGKGGADSTAIKQELEKALAENTNLVTSDTTDYSMNIPKHMTSTTELNDEASLQYQDAAKELYVICIDEAKTDFIKTFSDPDLDSKFSKYDDKLTPEKNYRMIQMEIMKGKMSVKSEPTVKKAVINGLDAEIVDFTANVEGINYDIYYKLAFIEGTKNMYMLMTWTLDSSKNENMDEMDQMINSFKLKR
ncbi:MAG TPA: hypothetical protein VFJ43_05630 [Bacteroidia bacterium]|nr:hypothetical protein [Bacteroidia bacterium]